MYHRLSSIKASSVKVISITSNQITSSHLTTHVDIAGAKKSLILMITFVSKHQPTFGDLASCFFTCMSLPSNFHLCTRYKNRNFLLNYNMQPQNNCVVIRILVCSLLLSNFSISCTMRPKPFWSGICISCFKNFVIFFSGNSVLYLFIKTKESIQRKSSADWRSNMINWYRHY